jgi:hypothetical protein
MSLTSLILAISPGLTILIVIAGIVILIIAVSSLRRKEEKEDTGPSAIDMKKDMNWSPEVMAMYMLGKQMVFNRDFDEAILVFQRMLSFDPTNWTAGTMIGNLTFEKDKELSFVCLKMLEQHWENEGASFNDPALRDYALYFYMLGFHYNRHNIPGKAYMFHTLAMNSRSFVKEYKDFRKRFPYEPQQSEEEKLFDQAFSSFGGLYTGLDKNMPLLQNKVRDIKKEYADLDHHLKYSVFRIANIYFDTIFNLNLNACASKLGDQYFIGINLGTYCILEDLFDKMMASNNVLPDIGNISLETSEKKFLNVTTIDTDLIFTLPNQLPPPKKCKDAVRGKMADIYKSFAFQFIALHEYYHVVQGHMGYLRSKNLPVYAELRSGSNVDESIDFSTEQVMEWDADTSATIRAFIIASHFLESNKPEIRSLPCYKDWESFIYHWTFAVYSSFRLFGFKQYNDAEARTLPHPPASVRMAIISMAIIGLFTGESFTKIDKNMSIIMFEATIAAEEALKSISFASDNSDVYLNNWKSEEMKEYMLSLLTKNEQIRPLFKPFSYDLSHFTLNNDRNNVNRLS